MKLNGADNLPFQKILKRIEKRRRENERNKVKLETVWLTLFYTFSDKSPFSYFYKLAYLNRNYAEREQFHAINYVSISRLYRAGGLEQRGLHFSDKITLSLSRCFPSLFSQIAYQAKTAIFHQISEIIWRKFSFLKTKMNERMGWSDDRTLAGHR